MRCPANVAIACSSQPIRARSVKHRCRVVWVENRGRLAANATRRTTFYQVHNVTGSARLRRDSDRNKPPGPGSASPGAAGTPTAARPWAPSTAPPAHGGSSSSMLCFGLTEPAGHQTLKSAADLRTRNRIVKGCQRARPGDYR